jgi:hypothetical protein
MKDNRPPKEQRTLKRGDVREDGMVFWCYSKTIKSGEMWVTRDKFDEKKKLIQSDAGKERQSISNKKSYQKNKEKRSAKQRAYYYKNREKRKAQKIEYLRKNKEAIAVSRKLYYDKNKSRIIKRQVERAKQRKIEDPAFRLSVNLRSRLREAMSRGVGKKVDGSLVLTGCSWEELRIHIESQFSDGMSWDNYGVHGWHVDHIKPCASFDLTLDSEQRECFHYTNLQPLWAEDNWKKGQHYEE